MSGELKAFKSESFAEILAKAQTLPGVDPSDPELASLLQELSKDAGFVMIGFPTDGASVLVESAPEPLAPPEPAL